MNDSSTLASSTYSGKLGLWQWLLRSIGLEAWFRRAPTVAHAGQEERILLLLTLKATAPATLLATALRECEAALKASGGEVVSYQPDTMLLAWPIGASQPLPPVVAFYFQLRSGVRRLASSPTLSLSGAAGLGWATLGAASSASHYDKASLREVAGILHESQQVGGELLLSAALHQHLAPTAPEQCTLHLAFEVPGHRYPATLYQVVDPVSA